MENINKNATQRLAEAAAPHPGFLKKTKNMTTLELLKAVSAKANETKKELTKSFFSGDKSYFNTMLAAFPKADVNGNVYETINNIASMYARGLEY